MRVFHNELAISKVHAVIIALIVVVAAVAGSLYLTSSFGASKMNIVSCSIIIDKASDFDALDVWLTQLNFTKFTFVVSMAAQSYILDNETRVNVLNRFGKMIPRLEYVQQYNTATRESLIDGLLSNFSSRIGYTPDGVMNFQPDTFSDNYLLSKGVKYSQGYCFDQYAIDFMSMRGGFQMPYYASATNNLVPSSSSGGMVILPHSTWDWIDGLTVAHTMQLHPVDLVSLFNGNTTLAKQYFLELVNTTLAGTTPFGLAIYQFEWSWTVASNLTAVAQDWMHTLMTRPQPEPYVMWDFSTLVTWFTETNSLTPTYRVLFKSPYDGETIEWYYSTTDRVARVNSYVVSFTDYTNQAPDQYNSATKTINWRGDPKDPNNCVDTSLKLTIDALGGAMKYPINTEEEIYYKSDLSKFYDFYSSENK